MNSRIIFRNSLWMSLATGFDFLANLVCSVAVARVLGPKILGYYSYVLWAANAMGMVATLGVPAATRKYCAELLGREDIGTARAVIRFSFRVQSMSAAAVLLLGFALVATVVPPAHRLYSFLAVMSLLPLMLMMIISEANMANEDFASNTLASLLGTLVNFLGVVLSLVRGWGLVGLAASFLASRIVDCVLRYWLFRRNFPMESAGRGDGQVKQLPPELVARLRRFCLQSSGLLLLNMIVWDRSEVFFLGRFCDIRQVAFYSLSFNILRQLMTVPSLFATTVSATVMVQQGRDPRQVGPMTTTALRYQALLALPMALGLAALTGPVIRILYGSLYLPAIPVLAVVALFSAAAPLSLPARFLLLASENQGFLLWYGGTVGVVNILLDLLLIPPMGALGAALANGAAQLAAALGTWAFVARRFAVPLPIRPLLKLGVCACGSGVWAAMAARCLPTIPAAALGVAGGVAVFLLLLRWTGAVESDDRNRLLTLESQFPVRLRGWYVKSLKVVAP